MISRERDSHTAGSHSLSVYGRGDQLCEMLSNDCGRIVWERLLALDPDDLRSRAQEVMGDLLDRGITFTVYSEKDAIDRILPFDIIPRVIGSDEWGVIERGVTQRVMALNEFLRDIYSDGQIISDGVVPGDLVYGNANYRSELKGYVPPLGTHVHVAGVDLIRDGDGTFLVLEDNARTPSGVSYVVENRFLMQRAFPDLLDGFSVRDVSVYGSMLSEKLAETAPRAGDDPTIVLLSPGVFNSAYFEHIFLAQELGVQLVEGRDLFVEDNCVFMRTIRGPERVDVIYRRIDDAFLDPEVFNPESLLGVPGLVRAMMAGNVTLANAIGTGVCDDKAVYAYMPRIIKYYLGEDAILQNVDTHICREPEALTFALENLGDLVVKPVGESGGYGITIGPKATKAELADCAAQLKANPENFIAQPMIDLSVCPTLTDSGVAPCHVDLRPFAVTGKETWVLPGGLTRVAMKPGSIIVNSSQGGGTKDTWVLERAAR